MASSCWAFVADALPAQPWPPHSAPTPGPMGPREQHSGDWAAAQRPCLQHLGTAQHLGINHMGTTRPALVCRLLTGPWRGYTWGRRALQGTRTGLWLGTRMGEAGFPGSMPHGCRRCKRALRPASPSGEAPRGSQARKGPLSQSLLCSPRKARRVHALPLCVQMCK